MPKKIKFSIPPLDREPTHLPGPAALKPIRENLGLSQEQLAKESGVSRSVIANYESGRTKLNGVSDALKLYRALEIKERARKDKLKTPTAADLLAGLLWLQKLEAAQQVAEIDSKIEALQRDRDRLARQTAEIEAEEARLKGR
jgi:transcriptional regulator with XRE-family HTH domain